MADIDDADKRSREEVVPMGREVRAKLIPRSNPVHIAERRTMIAPNASSNSAPSTLHPPAARAQQSKQPPTSNVASRPSPQLIAMPPSRGILRGVT